MKRKIIEIDETKCDGCGLCANACHEGAIGIAGGKAHLLRDDYCDGMGDCLPACPAGAINFVEREAAGYNGAGAPKERNWPVQIKLTATRSPAFKGHLTIAADCVGFRGNVKFSSPLLIGCPKLDGVDYSGKLAEILAYNTITSVSVHRMSVPCCGGLVRMVESAAEKSGYRMPVEVIVTEVS
jgi:NAD-dependent dihydropyrimidine dehydrogenase PreA subunit